MGRWKVMAVQHGFTAVDLICKWHVHEPTNLCSLQLNDGGGLVEFVTCPTNNPTLGQRLVFAGTGISAAVEGKKRIPHEQNGIENILVSSATNFSVD